MEHFHGNRWDQLRAVEADILCPPPADPFQIFPSGWTRASELSEKGWRELLDRRRSQSPPPREPSPDVRRAIRRTPPPRVNRVAPIRLPERRPLRQLNANDARRPAQDAANRINQENMRAGNIDNGQPRRRALSPTQLPGVRAIPKDFNRFFRGLLTPGEFFAKSQTRYLGPFDEMPTEDTLPAADEYIILQRMGRLPDSGKSIFRQVGNLST
ncbi:uncharacterized protein CELE_C05C10.5 [Caenorhabditis elegans]|uniref:Uncharacterized protein C05C10.5 n=2 Tax=Caenorhabditis elegans TaxID=6239 RepID=YQ15_CAEEL|nr:Uncharacterized protein CELE_C05C10.5 [Caenorhabditis elegans]Q09230.1 RecName: Full=Uncharacterized protein C05C10.5 [Caenorhabditis elegans]CAA88203.1 Uncharacterized protein CELE_C05C10.5 [Caenorhabditis elegans]|eukprot:NP_001021918.1 Uncharacterized protein CELE_C05C10.5 [Caenorhabditis elegans]